MKQNNWKLLVTIDELSRTVPNKYIYGVLRLILISFLGFIDVQNVR